MNPTSSVQVGPTTGITSVGVLCRSGFPDGAAILLVVPGLSSERSRIWATRPVAAQQLTDHTMPFAIMFGKISFGGGPILVRFILGFTGITPGARTSDDVVSYSDRQGG